ncbi:heme peroxidase [Phycomyces nitens]|nr:heme peroxidase [Phycomyces nitens]
MTALGGAAGYYYHNSEKSIKKVTTQKKKDIDYEQIYKEIAELLDQDEYFDDGSYAPLLFRLSWHCSGTYDKNTDTGGSNGATMRFLPESGHAANKGLDIARNILEKVHEKHPEISYGDLWTLAGVCAVQEMGGPTIPWRPGRADALTAKQCTPDGRLPDGMKKQDHIREIFYRMGFNDQEIVALVGGHTVGRCHIDRSGFEGPWDEAPTIFDNEYFTALVEREWVKKELPSGVWQWVSKENPDVMMLPAEIYMYNDKEFRKYFELYAKDQDKFFEDFAKAYKKLIELGVHFDDSDKEYKFKTVNV